MGSSILLNGVQNDNIYVIWDGVVEVRVTRTDPDTGVQKSMWFENLSRGACLNVYSAFTEKMTSLVDFFALTKFCIIKRISVKDIKKLAAKRKLLKDKLEILIERITNEDVDSLDFFTCSKKYIHLETYDSNYSKKEEDKQLKLMKKFRKSVLVFVKQLKEGEVEFPKAVDLLNQIKKDRVVQTLKECEIAETLLEKKGEVVNVFEMYEETREDMEDKHIEKILQQQVKYQAGLRAAEPFVQHKFAELVDDAIEVDIDQKINKLHIKEEEELPHFEGGENSKKSEVNLSVNY